MMPPKPKHWALLLYLVVFWGFAFGLIAMALEAFHPVALVWGRLTLGAMVMACVLLYKRLSLPKEPIWLLRLLVLSVTGNVMPFVLIAWAEQHVASGEVGLLMALMPITTLVMGHYLLTHEKFTQQRMLGVFLGLAGVALLLGDDWWVYGGEMRLSGQLVTLLATFCYAANGIYAKRLPVIDPVVLSAGSLTVGSILLLVPAMWIQDWSQAWGVATPWFALFVLGTMATGVATWVYFIVVGEVGPGFLSTINYLIPGVAFLVGIAVLGETAGWPQFMALLLILSGVWLIQPRHPKLLQAQGQSLKD
ncbi:MAG: DMT family transporter [Luminiphilus sp.]|nr:DMT family transporter [Luminiphilus sp.]